MKNIFLCFFLSFLVYPIFSQDDKKDYSEAFKLIEVWLEAQKDFEKLPGISAVVIDDQEVLWSGGFGMSNPEKNVPTEPSTICSICSISKLFTSVAIMKLYDEGKLRLDDKVSDLLPWYNLEQKYAVSGPVTIRGLLTHSSGLPRESDYPYWSAPDFTFPSRDQIKVKLSDQETLYPSATYFQYSNLGLTLLGEIVEEVSGIPYDEYITNNILEPLGLTNTRTELPESLYGDKLAIGYSALTRKGNREKVNLFQANGIKPAAGYSSTVLDLAKFASWNFRLRDTTMTEILKPSTLKNMQRVHWTDPDWETTWGLGFSVYKGSDGTTWASHGGSCPGYRSTLQLNLKKKMAYSVMINSSGTNPGKYARGIREILKEVEGSSKEETPESGESKVNLEEYVGYYSVMPWWSEAYISTWEGKLVSLSLPADSPGEAMTYYKHMEGDTFRRIREDDELGEEIVFERDDNGKVYRYKRNGNYWPLISFGN